jgi:hypothetical protein
MDKISGIVSPSARVGSTDMKNAPPVRPGMPSFGRPVGTSTRIEHPELSTAQRAGLLRDEMADEKKMRIEAKAASDVSAKFFARPEEEFATERVSAHEQTLANLNRDRAESELGGDEIIIAQPSKFTPRGSHIDVRA